MKKYLYIIIITLVYTFLMGAVSATIFYKNYIKASEELLWELEMMCEENGLPWGDTVCEGDNWCNYCEAREALGLDHFQHYSKKE